MFLLVLLPIYHLLAALLYSPSRACAPPPSLFGNNFVNPSQSNIVSRHPANSRAFGEQVHRPADTSSSESPTDAPQNNVLGGIEQRASTASGPVKDPKELFCYEFNDKCRWRNMEGLLVDDLDWYQGNGFLDENRLRLATGTHISPDGFYLITATDKVELAGAKGILVSDVIQCQTGTSELRLMYWTSPEVKITVCVKSVLRLFPYFDYCSTPIENNDPGPAYITLPDLGGEPLQIFIQAHNFVFNSAALQGGFAIIDNLEYYGEFCESADGYQHLFAQSNVAPSDSVPSRTPMPLSSASKVQSNDNGILLSPESIYNNVIDSNSQGGGGGFSSLLDWMLLGGGAGLGNANGTATTTTATNLGNILPNFSPTVESATLSNSPRSIFELNAANNIFPTLMPSQFFATLPALTTISDQQTEPTFNSNGQSSTVSSYFRPQLMPSSSAAVVGHLSKGQSAELENGQKQPNSETEQIMAPQNRLSAGADPLGALRSIRIVQHQQHVDNSENNIEQKHQPIIMAGVGQLIPGGDTSLQGNAAAAAVGGSSEHNNELSTAPVASHRISNSDRWPSLPNWALLNKRKMVEQQEALQRAKAQEVADEKHEEEGQEEAQRVRMMNDGDEDEDNQRHGPAEDVGITEEPTFVEREEWIGK